MFKKNLGIGIAVVAAAAMMLTGCGSKSKETEAPATTAETQAPATEEKATEAPATEAKATEAPATEAKATEAPATEAKATEAPATEAKETEAAATEVMETEKLTEAAAAAPATEAPATELATEAKETEAPATEAKETEAPATEAKETEAPATEAKETEAPATEAKETEAPATEAKETEAAVTEAATEAAELKTAEEAGVADGVYSVEAELEGGTGRAHFEGPLTVVVEDGKAELTFMMSSEHYDYVKVDGKKYEKTNTEGNSTFTVPLAGFDGPFAFVGDTTAMSEPHEIDYTVTINAEDLVSAPADAGSVEAATEAEAAAAADETEAATEAKETEAPATEEAAEAKETEAAATEAKETEAAATEAKETEAAETEMTVTEAQTEAMMAGTEVETETEAELKTAEEAGVEDGVYTVAAELEGGIGRAHLHFDGDLIVVVEDGKAELTFMMSSEHYDYVKVDGKKYEKTNTEGNSTFTVPLAGFDGPFAFVGDTTAMSKPHEIDYTVTINSKDLVPAPADAGSVETEADTEA